jgi:hypothetical protein
VHPPAHPPDTTISFRFESYARRCPCRAPGGPPEVVRCTQLGLPATPNAFCKTKVLFEVLHPVGPQPPNMMRFPWLSETNCCEFTSGPVPVGES